MGKSWLRRFRSRRIHLRQRDGAGAAPALEVLEPRMMLSAAFLDPTFGGDGAVSADYVDTTHNYASELVRQSDGKLVLIGDGVRSDGRDITVTRYNPDGTLDATFGVAGAVRYPLQEGHFVSRAGAIDSEGRIVIGATWQLETSTVMRFAVVRLLSDGSLDASFNAGKGYVITDLGANWHELGDIATDAADNIVVAGHARGFTAYSDYDWVVARYNSSGELDSSFSGDGWVSIDGGTAGDCLLGVAIDPSGRILVSGGTSAAIAIARMLPNGELDAGFGAGGIVSGDFGLATARDVAVDASGRIVIAGHYDRWAATTSDFLVGRLLDHGQWDTSFGGAGTGLARTHLGTWDSGEALALNADGTILVAGKAAPKAAVLRYTTDGLLDATFGNGGWIKDGRYDDRLFPLAVLPDGDGGLITAGTVYLTAAGHNDAFMARYDHTGAVDLSWGSSGVVLSDSVGSGEDRGADVFVQPDGKTLVLGTIKHVSSYSSFAVTRYNIDGTLDTTFGVGGNVLIDHTPGAFATAMAVDRLGRIVVAGWGSTPQSGRLGYFHRLLPNGQIDTSFGVSGHMNLSLSTGSVEVHGITLDSQERIVFVGNIGSSQMIVGRLRANGSWDTSFGYNGRGYGTISSGGWWRGTGVTVDAQDRVLAVASAWGNMGVARFTASGLPDSTFGTNGAVVLDFNGLADAAYSVKVDAAGRIVVGGEAGYPGYNGQTWHKFALVRLTDAGALDTTFGLGGGVTTEVRWNSFGRDVEIDAAGRILLAGSSAAPSGLGNNFTVVRYLSDGSVDTSFANAGILSSDLGEYVSDDAVALAIDARANLVLAGSTLNRTTGYDIAVARYDVTAPQVQSVTVSQDYTALIVQMSDDDLNVFRATDRSHYRLVSVDRHGRESELWIQNVTYNAATDQIIISTGDSLLDKRLQLHIDGDNFTTDNRNGLTDLAGNHLQGGDYVSAQIDLYVTTLINALKVDVLSLKLTSTVQKDLLSKLDRAYKEASRFAYYTVIDRLEEYKTRVVYWHGKKALSDAGRTLLFDGSSRLIYGLKILRGIA